MVTSIEEKTLPSRIANTPPLRKVVTGVGLFLAVCVIAVAGYMASGWRLDDSIYMVVITIFGVGYGEVQPVQSPALRALTILVIIAGYGAVIYTVGGFMQMLIDGELNRALGERRMSKEIQRLENHTIVCGVGRMGTILARELHCAGRPFVVVDADADRVRAAEDQGFLVINGDATDEQVLERAGIRRATTLASVLSADATNVFVTVTARDLNPQIVIIARAENPSTEKKLLNCGANRVVLPTAIGATKVVQLIIRPTAESLLERLTSQGDVHEELGQIGLQFHDVKVAESSPLIDRPLSEIEVRGHRGFLIVGVRRADGSTVLNPVSTFTLAAGDELIVLGRKEDLPQLAKRLNPAVKQITYRGVKIETMDQ